MMVNWKQKLFAISLELERVELKLSVRATGQLVLCLWVWTKLFHDRQLCREKIAHWFTDLQLVADFDILAMRHRRGNGGGHQNFGIVPGFHVTVERFFVEDFVVDLRLTKWLLHLILFDSDQLQYPSQLLTAAVFDYRLEVDCLTRQVACWFDPSFYVNRITTTATASKRLHLRCFGTTLEIIIFITKVGRVSKLDVVLTTDKEAFMPRSNTVETKMGRTLVKPTLKHLAYSTSTFSL